MSKEELKKMLSGMSKEDLIQVIAEMQDDQGVHSIENNKPKPNNKRKRGKGKRGKKSKSRRRGEGHSTKSFGDDKGDKARTSSMDLSGNRPNKFEDFMKNASFSSSERQELKAAEEADKVSKSFERTPRTREGVPLTEVECMVCGREDEVSAVTLQDINRYTCNNCCVRR
jgi:hypothetical protein|tara:strand:+ start:1479 stop:1988 length:510 start_codon:yes stop_codon:yes gene_type:complete